ncbi:MAG TPA: methyltransferase domain-containing protein [Anaerolineae bacterium]
MSKSVVATKEMVEDIFDGAAGQYDCAGPDIFRRFGARLVERMVIAPGAHVLDIGTGKGAVLIPAAQRVGSAGNVIGIDLSGSMLAEVERAGRAAGLANFQTHKMDAERLDFPDASFDVVTCAFSLFFFPAMDAALREMCRVLKPGGRLGISLWGREPFGIGWKILAEQFGAYDAIIRMPQRVAYSPETVEALLAASGFIDIETWSEITDVVYASADEWWDFQLTLGSRAAIYRLDEETRAKFKTEYSQKMRPFFQADGLHLSAPVVYAVASSWHGQR